jgi:hypothetical protein
VTSISEQLTVLAFDHEFGVVELSVIDLVFDPHEKRIPKGMPHGGEWVSAPLHGDVPGPPGSVNRYVVPSHDRLISTRGIKDPADHPFWQEHPVSKANILAAYDQADAGTREQGRHWYRQVHDLAGQYIAPGNPEEGGILLSNYSPQTNWPLNMFNAARSRERGKGLGAGEGIMTTNDQAKKADRAMAGEGIAELMNTAKTHSFGVLIKQGDDSPDDPYGHVVIDTHAVNVAAGGTIRGKLGAKAPIGDARQHEYVADLYRQAAQEISQREGKLMKPHELQAITWLVQIQANEAADAWALEHGPSKEKGLIKAKATSTRNNWRNWIAYAKERGIPLTPGISAPAPGYSLAAELVLAQLVELMSEGSLTAQLIELAAWEHELRDPKAGSGNRVAPGR